MSVSSLQTTMSALSNFGLGSNQNSGWWGGKKADISFEIKYIYSALTKIPALRIGPPPLKLILDFEDCPGELSIPLDAFKNVQLLEFEDTDPRAFIGWDRLSSQLRSLSIKRSGVEDITDILVEAVILDAKRRRGERVRHRVRKVHAPESQDEEAAAAAAAGPEADIIPPAHQLQAQLPSLSWHFLRHLSLADNSLTFLPSSCLSVLTSLTSLDLSSNLLNAVPPSLNLLPSLQSLNLTNNLIDSVMGIYDALPSIQALNLSQNRLESLCGLERLPTLKRIDLRKNEIFEAGEVGRLAILPRIVELYIAGNPLFEEVDDARVDVFVEFAKEGNKLDSFKLDSEVIGYFERQRVRERLPNMDRLSTRDRETTPSADEAMVRMQAERTASRSHERVESEPMVKTVRHRNNHHSAAQKSDAARRNRRVVELPQDSSGDSALQRVTDITRVVEEVSDSDAIKRAALAGDNDAALGSMPIKSLGDAEERSKSPLHTLTKKSGATMATVTKEWDESSDKYVRLQSLEAESTSTKTRGKVATKPTMESNDGNAPGPRQRVGRKQVDLAQRSKKTLSLYDDEAGGSLSKLSSAIPQAGDHDLRKKIEALKGEVGDDWLRLLARGESVYVPQEKDESRA
jgi:hypothetical protein